MQAREAAMGFASPAAVIRTPVQYNQTVHTGVNAPSPTILSASLPSPAGGNTDPVVVAPTPNSRVQVKKTTHAGANFRVDVPSPSDDSLVLYEFNKPPPPMSPRFLANLAEILSDGKHVHALCVVENINARSIALPIYSDPTRPHCTPTIDDESDSESTPDGVMDVGRVDQDAFTG